MLQKLTGLKASISTYQSLVSQQEDLQTLWELANEEQDEDLEPEIEQASHALQKELEKLVADIEKKMKKAAAELDFETAAELRDRMIELKKQIHDI